MEASEDKIKLRKKIEDERKEAKEKETKDREMREKKIKRNMNILLFILSLCFFMEILSSRDFKKSSQVKNSKFQI